MENGQRDTQTVAQKSEMRKTRGGWRSKGAVIRRKEESQEGREGRKLVLIIKPDKHEKKAAKERGERGWGDGCTTENSSNSSQ